MNIEAGSSCIDIIWSCARTDGLPADAEVSGWVEAVLAEQGYEGAEVAINLVSAEEISRLNQTYRQRDSATNVLSFPSGLETEDGLVHLGDIAICIDVVRQEAEAQGKPLPAHLAHMVVHGMLHLLGFDHVIDTQAEIMEQMEADILAKIGHPNPYGIEQDRR